MFIRGKTSTTELSHLKSTYIFKLIFIYLFKPSCAYSSQPIHFTGIVLYLLLQVHRFYFSITISILTKN